MMSLKSYQKLLYLGKKTLDFVFFFIGGLSNVLVVVVGPEALRKIAAYLNRFPSPRPSQATQLINNSVHTLAGWSTRSEMKSAFRRGVCECSQPVWMPFVAWRCIR